MCFFKWSVMRWINNPLVSLNSSSHVLYRSETSPALILCYMALEQVGRIMNHYTCYTNIKNSNKDKNRASPPYTQKWEFKWLILWCLTCGWESNTLKKNKGSMFESWKRWTFSIFIARCESVMLLLSFYLLWECYLVALMINGSTGHNNGNDCVVIGL